MEYKGGAPLPTQRRFVIAVNAQFVSLSHLGDQFGWKGAIP